ncbi:hypothetical protein [Actomonas aquatica]|uniref:DUF2726 domain-containing protein n=1 Tax=Actomonas aquatica TaxID=2866162 RepID=A0ABZ1C2X6_9BACT|nr:hypothetical protein [Opitutus sp. WL0086]WRQ85717.1 hypothetical protein K1X11_012965 [Opitutus sp. WL0086]
MLAELPAIIAAIAPAISVSAGFIAVTTFFRSTFGKQDEVIKQLGKRVTERYAKEEWRLKAAKELVAVFGEVAPLVGPVRESVKRDNLRLLMFVLGAAGIQVIDFPTSASPSNPAFEFWDFGLLAAQMGAVLIPLTDGIMGEERRFLKNCAVLQDWAFELLHRDDVVLLNKKIEENHVFKMREGDTKKEIASRADEIRKRIEENRREQNRGDDTSKEDPNQPRPD